ncbi:MAG: hypothetical protein OXH52_12845 [Gammaproteobacteria bacterium]|nr:hypothetical protein [Gammaproteobacteria bacterium]
MIGKDLVELLDGLFGRESGWAVAGGHAANVYRVESRFTEDVDLLVSLGSRSMDDAASGLTERGWTVRAMMLDALGDGRLGSQDVWLRDLEKHPSETLEHGFEV